MNLLSKDYGISRPENQSPSLISKLERNERELGCLRRLLGSHVCEPRTQDLFERIEILKGGLERLVKNNLEIRSSLYPKGKSCCEFLERSEEQFSEAEELRKGIKVYMMDMSTDWRRLRYDERNMVPT